MSVITVRTDNYLLWTVSVYMLLEKSFLKFCPALVRTQHFHKIALSSMFLQIQKKKDSTLLKLAVYYFNKTLIERLF